MDETCTCIARVVGIESVRRKLYQFVVALHITVGRVAIALALIERTEEHGLVGQDKARSYFFPLMSYRIAFYIRKASCKNPK